MISQPYKIINLMDLWLDEIEKSLLCMNQEELLTEYRELARARKYNWINDGTYLDEIGIDLGTKRYEYTGIYRNPTERNKPKNNYRRNIR